MLRSRCDILHFAWWTEYCPLTLTLSLPPSRRAKAPLRRDGGRERESRFRIGNWCLAGGCWANSGPGVIEMHTKICAGARPSGRFTAAISWRLAFPQRPRACATRKRRKRRAPSARAATTLSTYRGEGGGEGEPSVSNPAVHPVIRKYRAGTRRYYLLPSQKGNAQTIFGSPMMGTPSMLEVPPPRRRSPVKA